VSSNNRFVWQGLTELKLALRNLPTDLRGEAANIIEGTANRAAMRARAKYPDGELREGVEVDVLRTGRFGAGRLVVNRVWYSMIYEHGTQAARRTSKGWNRGIMPPGNAFVPAMEESRREMYVALRDMLRRTGLTVIG